MGVLVAMSGLVNLVGINIPLLLSLCKHVGQLDDRTVARISAVRSSVGLLGAIWKRWREGVYCSLFRGHQGIEGSQTFDLGGYVTQRCPLRHRQATISLVLVEGVEDKLLRSCRHERQVRLKNGDDCLLRQIRNTLLVGTLFALNSK